MEPLVDEPEDRREIPLSKTKLLMLFLGSVAFVAGGIWFVVAPPIMERSLIFKHPVMVAAVGWVSIIFFGYCAIIYFCKLFNRTPAFVVNKTGLTVNACGAAIGIGTILWSDVTGITVYEDPKECQVRFKWICLIVQNPDHYIDKQSNTKRRSTMCRSYNVCGTPIAISSSGLKISFEKLLEVLKEYYAMSRNG